MRVASLLALLVGCAGESAPPEPPSAERGAAVYATYCASCHQADGTGLVGGRALAGPFAGPDSRLSQSDEALLASIREGKTGAVGMMPPWRGVLSDQQQRDALAYIRATFTAP